MAKPEEIASFEAVVALHIISILLTGARLYHQYKRRQLWWDDLWASASAFFVAFIAAFYLCHVVKPREEYPETVQRFLSWIPFFITPLATWTARLSILVTIGRIIPPGINKRISQGSFCVFLLMLTGLLLSNVFLCGLPLPAKPSDSCVYSRRTAAVQLSLGLIATFWLVSWPIYVLARMKLPRVDRNLLIACFAFGMSLAIDEIAHTVNIVHLMNYPRDQMATFNSVPITLSGNFQTFLALLSCNSLILTTYLYRLWRNRKNSAQERLEDVEGSTTSKTSLDRGSGAISTNRETNTERSANTTTGLYSSVRHFTTMFTDSSKPTTDNTHGLSDFSTTKPPRRIVVNIEHSTPSSQAS